MGVKPTNKVDENLVCPACGHAGMYMLTYKAESGRSRYRCSACGSRTTKPLDKVPQELPKLNKTEVKSHTRFIITSAVNDTKLVTKAHKTLERMAEELGARYLIIPGVYKNPDLKHQGMLHSYTWPEEILPYVCNGDISLNKSLAVRGLTRIVYTATNPLAGMNHAGNIQSEIFGHPQIAMNLVPNPKHMIPKMLHTTGSISQRNYGGSKTAKKAEFHHSIGALFVEIEGDKFWPTQLNFDGEGFHLFDKYYTEDKTEVNQSVAAIVFGDTHVRFLNDKIRRLNEHVCSKLKPEHQIYHDLHDHHIGSHHHDHDTIFKLKKALHSEHGIKKELMLSVKFLDDKPNAVIVDSNHNRHLDQWFNRFKPHSDSVNLPIYFELATMLHEDLQAGGDGNLFKLFVQKYCKQPVKFADGNHPFIVKGIDCGQHGDRGPNGARGSAKSFSKTGFRTVIGHSHTPAIEKGCYQVGTSTLDLPYAVGYSSWMITNCIIYANGKRGLFSFVKGKLSPLMRSL